MADLPVQNIVFPFFCKNPDCDSLYDIEDFIHVALLWGYIHLVGSQHQIIGITCPECRKTSINKYLSPSPDFSLGLLEKSVHVQDSQKLNGTIKFRKFVPFSKKILYWQFVKKNPYKIGLPRRKRVVIRPFSVKYSLEEELFPRQLDTEFFLSNSPDDEIFALNETIKPIFDHYPNFITEEFPYRWPESYINHLCDIENRYDVKGLPRIVSNHSIYNYSDAWLRIKPDYIPSRKVKNEIVEAFDRALAFKTMSRYQYLIADGAGLAGHRNINFPRLIDAWDNEESRNKIAEYFESYNTVRNYIEFDLDCQHLVVKGYLHETAWEVLDAYHGPKPKKKRKVAIFEKHRLACRKAAEKIWKKHPTITIADMIMRNEIANACDGKMYTEATLRDYLKGLKKDAKPGRPKKK